MARATDIKPRIYEFQAVVTRYHIYHQIRSPVIGERRDSEQEPEYIHEKYAVKVVKNDNCWACSARYFEVAELCYFYWVVIKVEVIWKPQNKCNNGIEVPCKYTIKGPVHNVDSVETISGEYIGRVYEQKN